MLSLYPSNPADACTEGVWRLVCISRTAETDTSCTLAMNTPLEWNLEQTLSAVRAAVTKWCRTYEEGMELYAFTDQDLNIGDVAGYMATDRDLRACLREQKVYDVRELVVSVFQDAGVWHYDTLLCAHG